MTFAVEKRERKREERPDVVDDVSSAKRTIR